eukprot:GFUD01010066.1.p1 GENE.GFUD01010066.1~~GFUD01010066.1.p1  ORF type:complete len:228 (+),score=72.56 GFUD01010066.1:70-753(+)
MGNNSSSNNDKSSVKDEGSDVTDGAGTHPTVFNDKLIKDFADSSGMTVDQVQDHLNHWLGKHSNGKMDRKEFGEVLNKAIPKLKKEAVKKVEKHVFRIYDSNADGFIDFREFMVVFSILTGGDPTNMLRKIFRIFDVNSDGTISKDEMLTLVHDLHVILDDDCQHNTDDNLAKSVFKEMDKNKDSVVSEEEFINSVLSQKKSSKFLTMKAVGVFADNFSTMEQELFK